jgi:cytochrome c-type biogenesis protein CcmH/NrfF
MIPLAHIGHWLWVFYVLPVVIVVIGIVVSSRAASRRERQNEEDHSLTQSREDH